VALDFAALGKAGADWDLSRLPAQVSIPDMRWKFKTAFRICGLVLLLLPAAAVWRAMAQTNAAVEITRPADNARFNPGADIRFDASVAAGAGGVQRLEFALDDRTVGAVSNAPYSFVWSNAPMGTYTLTARAIYSTGQLAESSPVHLRVYNALLTFGLDRVTFLEEHKLAGISLWQYAASLIYIFLAFYVSKFLDYLTRVWLKKWAEKTETKFDDLLLELLNGPTRIVAFVIFLRIGLDVFSWPALVQSWLNKAFTIVVAGTTPTPR